MWGGRDERREDVNCLDPVLLLLIAAAAAAGAVGVVSVKGFRCIRLKLYYIPVTCKHIEYF
jgi:hypothetical protein